MFTVTGDTTLPDHFFNISETGKSYAWRPWEQPLDRIAVEFRVYMKTEEGINDGYDPADTQPQEVGILGGVVNAEGPLSWDSIRVFLHREDDDPDLPGFHLYSGVVYYTMSDAGRFQAYRFALGPTDVESDSLTVAGDRFFFIPNHDSTLHWVYYGNSRPLYGVDGIDEPSRNSPSIIYLEQNFSNPFNPATEIRFDLPEAGRVELKIFNVFGRKIRTLIDEQCQAGPHNISWNGLDDSGNPVSSGVYFYRMKVGNVSKIMKMSLLR